MGVGRMTYTGVYTYGSEFIFAITFSEINISISIFNSVQKNSEIVLQPYMVVSKVSKEIRSHLVAHALTNKNNDVRAYFGSIGLINQLLKNINSFGLLKSMSLGELPVDEGSLIYGSLKLTNMNRFYNSVRKYPGIEYLASDVKELNTELKRHKVKNLSELSKNYDLSWILNEDGSFKRDYSCVTTIERLDAVIEGIRTHKEIGFDIESTGLDIYYRGGDRSKSDYMIGFGISWGENQAVYIPLQSHKFETLTAEYVLPRIMPLLEKSNLIMANGQFDIRGVYHEGYNLKLKYDVIASEYIIDAMGSRGNKSLKKLSRYYCNEETLELDESLGGVVDGNLILDMDKDVLTIYGCADVEQLFRVKHNQEVYLTRLQNPVKIDCRIAHVVAIADYYGIYIDIPLLNKLSEINQRDLETVEKIMWDYLTMKVRYLVAKSKLTENVKYKYNLHNEELIEYVNQIIETKKEMFNNIMESEEIKDLAEKLLCKPADKHSNRERRQFSSTPDLHVLIHTLLQYPIFQAKFGDELDMSTNDAYLEKLSNGFLTDSGEDFLKEDVMSCSLDYDLGFRDKKQELLLSKEKFKSKHYPFAYVLQVWRKLQKQRTAFCDVLLNNNVDGWYNTNYNTTYAATGRILNSLQTIQKYFKHAISAFPGMYGANADAKQIELRVMNGIASVAWEKLLERSPEDFRRKFNKFRNQDIIKKMSVPWADIHRENGCKMFNTTPIKMTKEQRGPAKVANFTIPYDGGPRIVQRFKLAGVVSKKKEQKIITEGKNLIASWKSANFNLNYYLESIRDLALTPVKDRSMLPPKLQNPFAGDYGIITDNVGRRRIFDLNYERTCMKILNSRGIFVDYGSKAWDKYLREITRSIKIKIRKEAGNFPIQGFAAELFKTALSKLDKRLREEGYSGRGPGKELAILTQFVHDEFTLMLSPEIHPFKIYSIIKDCCMMKIEGHPTYYWGVSLIKHWYDGKDDKFDAPIEFLDKMIEDYKANPEKFEAEDYKSDPQAYVQRYMNNYMHDYAKDIMSNYIGNGILNYDNFMRYNTNYFITTSIVDYSPEIQCDVSDMDKVSKALIYFSREVIDYVIYNDKRYGLSEINFVINNVESKQTSNNQDDTNVFVNTEINNFNDIDEFDDFDDLDDIMEDETISANSIEYTNSTDEVNFIDSENINPYEYIFDEFDDDEDSSDTECDEIGLMQLGDVYQLDITGLYPDTFEAIIAYLLQFRDDRNGCPINIINGIKMTLTQWKLSGGFSNQIVQEYMEQDKERRKVRNG